jgi:hypothetical protein
MTSEPSVVARDALRGVRVALSVSESADLPRLGLSSLHLDLVVAEVARAVFIAGGIVLYGGSLRDGGFTNVLLQEAGRFASDREPIEIFVPYSEHRNLSNDYLRSVQDQYGLAAKIVLLDQQGSPTSIHGRTFDDAEDAAVLTAMRETVARSASARVIVGGKLREYSGRAPGVLEEAFLSISERTPIYVAGGYGGASASIAKVLGLTEPGSFPADYPVGVFDAGVAEALETIRRLVDRDGLPSDGLDDEERRVLTATHRPSDVALVTLRGLARAS